MTTTAGYAPSLPLQDETSLPPLRLAPLARSQTRSDTLAPPFSYDSSSFSIQATPTIETKYPRIIVKDQLGRTLDTFTTLQDAIYRSSWARKKLGEFPKTPLEWRLPKAPVPSRPDYSRAGPKLAAPLDHGRGSEDQTRGGSHQSHEVGSYNRRIDLSAELLVRVPALEIAVEDVSFVAESLRHLPSLPSFSFLRQSILAGQSTYIQIVASILLHQKHLQAVEQREAEWNFPGFCSGCTRAGFCYGCSKNPRPHIHEDIPAMTGGGFRFWKRDRPRDPHDWKHPGNWRLPSSDEELRDVIEKYGGLAAYEQAALRAKQEMARQANEKGEDNAGLDNATKILRLERLKNLAPYAPLITIVSSVDYIARKIDEKKEMENVVAENDEEAQTAISMTMIGTDERADERTDETADEREENVADKDGSERSLSIRSEDSEESIDRTLVRVDTGYFDNVTEEDRKDVQSPIAEQDVGADNAGEIQKSKMNVQKESHIKQIVGDGGGGSLRQTRKTSRLSFVDKEKEQQDEEEARLRRERAKQSVPFGTQRTDVGYKAPKFFTVQKHSQKSTVAKDPFSTDRVLNVPKGPSFQLKKTEKKTTKFVDFKRGERGWTAPKKFEIRHDDKTSTKLKNRVREKDKEETNTHGEKDGDGDGDGNGDGDGDGNGDEESKKRGREDLSLDSGLDSSVSAAVAGDKDTSLDEKDKRNSGQEIEQGGVGEERQDGDGATTEGSKVTGKPKRREIVKKLRIEVSPPPESPPSPPRLPSPPVTKHIQSPPATASTAPSPAPPAAEEPPLPEFDVPAIPSLPEIAEKPVPVKKKEKLKFMVGLPPLLPAQTKEEPKKRRAPPKVRIIPKNLYKARRSRPAEAPVTAEELMDIDDPLDFLAKWCIINPDRLPFYEIIFEYAIAEQTPRYTNPEAAEQVEEVEKEEIVQQDEIKESDGKKKKGKSKKKTSSKTADSEERELKPDLFPAERGMGFVKSTMTIEEQHLEKLVYTLDLLQEKMMSLGDSLEELEAKRIKLLASKARETFPQVASPNYQLKKKKGKKGKKKKRQLSDTGQKLKPHEITDEMIVERLDNKMLNELCREKDMRFVDGEIEIVKEKIKEVKKRVEEIAREKLLTDAFCMNHFFMRQGLHNSPGEDFRRQQSELYNRLHPATDFEMNLEEVEEALQQINNHLLTNKEVFFLYSILDLPGRKKINFRLFSVIAALSEKVTQLDPVIRKLLNNFNYNALDIKMEKCKELFDLLESEHMPQGAAQAQSLAVELTAGGLRPEHTRYVLNKFNRESKGIIDFLDFVTYIPLFVEIHRRIILDPLKEDLDL